MVALQQGYERLKDERRQLDFEDVLLAAAGMLEAEPRVADQVREQYRFFVVDEYQDVSPLQHHLLRLWLGPRTDICVVGDVSQTIYSFAGASPDFLLGFEREHPGSVVVRLEQNYRSTRSIVTAANRLMQGHPGALSLRAVDENPAPIPKMVAHESDGSEARSVANQIAAQIDAGAAPESIAVLFRIGAQSQVIETALGDAGVPFRVRGALRFFDQREVKEALMLLRGASITTAEEPLFKTVSDVLRSIGWSQDPPDVRGAVRDRWEALDVLMRLAESSTAGTTLKQFVAEMLDRQSAQQEPTMPAVTLSTLHSAKGLEWDSVYIIGLVEGLIPITYAKDAAALDEERRLLYVGMTRARRTLALSWALSPQAGRAAARIPSRFIADLR